MTKYKRLTLSEAKEIISEYDNYDDESFEVLKNEWESNNINTSELDAFYMALRCKVLNVFNETRSEFPVDKRDSNEAKYKIDLNVGLCLYEELKIGAEFTIIDANDDDIWRYMSVKVFPDITYLRNPNPDKGNMRLPFKRFFSHTRRIWIKTLWWYIHLSWQGNKEKTFEVLVNNKIDNINKLFETPGRGFRINLLRRMVLEAYLTGPHTTTTFGAFTKLNNAKCKIVEPELTSGGVEMYSKRLLKEVIGTKEKEDAN